MSQSSDKRMFYRIISNEQPTAADFLSDRTQGEPPPSSDPEQLRMWEGISVYNTETQARNKALDYPWLGRYIAALEITEGGAITYQRTGRGRGHFTLWGEPDDLLGCIVRTVTA